MHYQFFGLERAPFEAGPDPSLVYPSALHLEALATIQHGVESRKGFILCTGEPGTGKTTLLGAYARQADPASLMLVQVTARAGPPEMAQILLGELGIAQSLEGLAAVQEVQVRLLEFYSQGMTVALVIDEAHALPPETLEFLRLLSNFETDTEKLVQIVLVGGPELDEMLSRRDMRQVSQRVTLRARLGPIDDGEGVRYIEHRLARTGARALSQVMTAGAARIIVRAAGGVPARINLLANNVLLAAFGAEQRPVRGRFARRAIREIAPGAMALRAERLGILDWFTRGRA